MSHAATIGNIISAIALIGSLLSAGFAGWQATIAREQTKLIQQQTVSSQEAVNLASKALCRTIETGLNVVDLMRVTFLGGFMSPLTAEQQTSYKNELQAQKMFLEHLSTENSCPPGTSK